MSTVAMTGNGRRGIGIVGAMISMMGGGYPLLPQMAAPFGLERHGVDALPEARHGSIALGRLQWGRGGTKRHKKANRLHVSRRTKARRNR